MPHIDVRIHRSLLVLSTVILTHSPVHAAQSNPKLESAYGAPRAGPVTEVTRQAGDGRTDAPGEGRAASPRPAPARGERPRQAPRQEAPVPQGAD
jgi:hypothetical protein